MARVCVMGMGFVGLTLGAVLAQNGHKVYGVDPNKALIEQLSAGKPHFHEAGLEQMLFSNAKNMSYSEGHPAEKMDVYIVCVGTPVNADKGINNSFVESAAKTISQNIQGGELVVLRSTVKVGTCRNIVKPLLDKSGKKYLLAFCPERAIEGKALEEQIVLPQIIGGLDEQSTRKADEFFRTFVVENVIMENLESAEMVKLLNNSYRDLTFAFANEVSLICQELGIDTYRAIEAANYNYKRSNIPKPGFVGGTCLTKDSYILSQSANTGMEKLVTHARKLNEYIPMHVAKKVAALVPDRKAKVLVAGLAFKGKPETDDTRNSPSLELISHLKSLGFSDVLCQDFAVGTEKIKELGFAAAELAQGLESDCIIIANNNPKYSHAGIEKTLSGRKSAAVVFDVWGMLDKKNINNAKITYISL